MKFLRKFAIAAALVIAAPVASFAQIGIGIGISVHVAPPALPVYVQPPIPAEGYIWTPGYWAYSDDAGYYWVPGVWVQPPTVGVLWTPPYWGFEGGLYGFHAGYWGPHVGFYGGINYGFGYTGIGFGGGLWVGSHFSYNSVCNNFGGVHVTNVYVNRTVINNTVINNHASFNGPGGWNARPRPEEMQAMHEQHMQPTGMQQQHFQTAASTPAQRFNANGGHPGVTAASSPTAFRQQAAHIGTPAQRDGFGHANEVNTRQGNQQARINNGVRSGQMTPGEARNVENRDTSINHQAQADRAANGGSLTNQERQQINQRQNNVSRSIANDNHNANNDAAAAARQGRSTQQVQNQAARTEQHTAPHPAAAPRPAPAARPAPAPRAEAPHAGGEKPKR
jgi:hypothetical protein